LWLVGFSLGPIFPSIISLMSVWVPARLLPSAVGFLASFGAVGAALFPWLAGVLAEQAGLWTLLPYVIVLTVVLLALWFALQGPKSLPQVTPQ
jgi:fucose permease